jgi:hypothetical protein
VDRVSADDAEARAAGLPLFAAAALLLGWNAAPDAAFCDGGELGTAAFTLGVPHPTGFAFDMLAAKAAGLLPLGTLGWRQNLVSALFAAGALALLGLIADRIGRVAGVGDAGARRLGAWLAAAALGTWTTFLFSAHELEVYSSALCALGVCGYAVLCGGRGLGPACVVLGLALGLHVTVGLVAAGLVLVRLAERGAAGLLRGAWRRAPLVLAGALVLFYLPLASLRDPPIDWGDPETLARVIEHLSGARIRAAFQHEMLGADRSAALVLLQQYAESGWLLLPALLGALVGLRGARGPVLGVLAVLCADLAYAVWINPMGLASRQVGHLGFACLSVLAALGFGWALALLRRNRLGRAASVLFSAGGIGALLWGAPQAVLADGHAASELHGSGGPLAALPPRAVVLCSNDDACAGGLFAVHVERVRPDLEVVPAQHLWDPTTRRRIPELDALLDLPPGMPPPGVRRALAQAALRTLVAVAELPRPLFFERRGPLQDAGLAAPVPDPAQVPYLRLAAPRQATSLDAAAVPARLDAYARVRGAPWRGERARDAWSSVYAELGATSVANARADLGVGLLARAVQLAPDNAVMWTNLGLAHEAIGQLEAASAAALQAIHLAPARSASPWLCLARGQLHSGQPEQARRTLAAAAELGVRDGRLDALRARLGQAGRPSGAEQVPASDLPR